MKRQYMKPAMQVVKIRQTQMLCGSPGTNDEVSTNPSYARQHGGRDDEWDDDWDEDWDEE